MIRSIEPPLRAVNNYRKHFGNKLVFVVREKSDWPRRKGVSSVAGRPLGRKCVGMSGQQVPKLTTSYDRAEATDGGVCAVRTGYDRVAPPLRPITRKIQEVMLSVRAAFSTWVCGQPGPLLTTATR